MRVLRSAALQECRKCVKWKKAEKKQEGVHMSIRGSKRKKLKRVMH
jgi:hypothetical protein